MTRVIPMNRSRHGDWYSPEAMGTVNYGQQFGPPSPDPTKIQDDFFAPGEEEKMNRQIAAENAVADFKKKLYMFAGGALLGLVLLAMFRGARKK